MKKKSLSKLDVRSLEDGELEPANGGRAVRFPGLVRPPKKPPWIVVGIQVPSDRFPWPNVELPAAGITLPSLDKKNQ